MPPANDSAQDDRREAARLVAARALRGFADGAASVLLPVHLAALGLSDFAIGAAATLTLLGSALLTLAVGLGAASRLAPRAILLGASALMAATGAGFAAAETLWPLLVVAFVGTLNPTGGDVTVFLPTEQALLAERSEPRARTALFARYNLGGALAGALGALAAGLPAVAARSFDVSEAAGMRAAFLGYGAVGLVLALLYRGMPAGTPARTPAPATPSPARRARPLERSRGVVLRLSALFALDSFGGGFAVQSLLVLWLLRRFEMPVEQAAAVMSASALLAALSQLASAPLARRIGLVRTMVFTHIPANLFLAAAAFMPSAAGAVACLVLRSSLSQMDVPARQAYVMSVVPPEERAAAASVTNVPRSLATAASPLLAGALLARTTFGWPLVIGGVLKLTYDLLLLAAFGRSEVPSGDPRAPHRGSAGNRPTSTGREDS